MIHDLLDVGKTKSLGYLSIETIEKYCDMTVEELMQWAIKNNLHYLLFTDPKCGVSSGALYFYDENMLMQIINTHRNCLIDANVPIDDAISFITYITKHLVPQELYPEAYVIIGKTFNDIRFRD